MFLSPNPFPNTEVSQGLSGQGEVAGVASKTSSRTTTPEPYYKAPHSSFSNPTLVKDTSSSHSSHHSLAMYSPDTPARVTHDNNVNGSQNSGSFSMATPQTGKQPDRASATGSNLSGHSGSLTGSGLGGAGGGHDNRAMIGDGAQQVPFHTAQGKPSAWQAQGNMQNTSNYADV